MACVRLHLDQPLQKCSQFWHNDNFSRNFLTIFQCKAVTELLLNIKHVQFNLLYKYVWLAYDYAFLFDYMHKLDFPIRAKMKSQCNCIFIIISNVNYCVIVMLSKRKWALLIFRYYIFIFTMQGKIGNILINMSITVWLNRETCSDSYHFNVFK